MNRQAPPGHGLKDEPTCYTCGRKRSVCLRVHDYEEQYGVPDPHKFETAEDAEARRAKNQAGLL